MARLPERFDPAAPLNNCDATAEYLGLSRGLVYAQARAGELPSVRIGSRLLIRTAALLAMLGEDPEK
ncbi:MAG: Helix-turn-helix domain protein [Actinobacteria bacterium ADurb.BinA094]|nr:MAG: Helix-turn-helix domain protein [Actinobacteria bacterium ADurb.BinA094]